MQFIEHAHAAFINLPNATDLATSDANANAAAFLNRIAELLLTLALPLAIVGVFFAAYSLIQAAGKPDGYTKARKQLMYVFTGIFFIVFAAILVRFSYNLLR